MKGTTKRDPLIRPGGLLRSSQAGSARPMFPGRSAALVAAGDFDLSHDLREWAHTPAHFPWPEGAHYRYRLGSHRLLLAPCGLARRSEAVIGRAEAEFALVVEGPLLVLGS